MKGSNPWLTGLFPGFDSKRSNSVDLVVGIVGIDSGNWAEISGYIIGEDTIQGSTTQENSLFVPFSAIRQVPYAVNDIPYVTVNVPALKLNPAANVRVITRVAEVQIWATRLGPRTAGDWSRHQGDMGGTGL